MKNNLDKRLELLAKEKRKGLMTHVVVGYPTVKKTVDIVRAMERAGADFVELQIPFSDPLADGPTIQHACEAALAGGVHVSDAFAVARELSQSSELPLLFMAYFNTVYNYGVERFCADAAAAGISGLIIPDAPLEAAEHEGLMASCEAHHIYNIATFSPASTDERLRKNATKVGGFVYCMARQGVTGTSQAIESNLAQYLNRVRSNIAIPIAVGFGIASKERVNMIAPYCDILVVGSAIIDIVTESKPDMIAKNVEQFIHALLPT